MVCDGIWLNKKPAGCEAWQLIASMVGAVHRTAWAIEVNRPTYIIAALSFEFTAVSLKSIPENEDRCGFGPTSDQVVAALE
jgi:hypothetical protein